MPRKKKEDTVNADIDSVSLSGTISADRIDTSKSDIKVRGETFSLNLKKESFLGIGDIWLSYKNHTAKIPEDISDALEKKIRNAVAKGILVPGDTFIPPITKDEAVLEEYWEYIKVFGLDVKPEGKQSDSVIKFRKLFKDGVDRNWTAKEIARFCSKREVEYKNRKRVLKLLEDLDRFSMCPDTLTEY